MRFQSPNYPAMVNNSMNCSSLFVSDSNNLWLAFINGAFDEALIDDNVTVSAQTIDFESNYDVRTYVSATGMMRFQFLNQLQITRPWIAFDAVVLPFSPSLSSDCPFSGQTITLDNETVIPIASDYGIFANPRNNCSWTFKIDDPSSYHFKIYIKKLANNLKLTIKNDTTTNGMGFNITVGDPQVMYLMGSELNITFTNVSNELNEFFAIISAVPISPNRVEGCTYKPKSNGRTIISNTDYINGYNEFTTCTYNISIQSGYEAIFEVTEFWVEAGVDKLTVSKDRQVYEMKNAEFFKIKSDLNGSMFKFVADGNIRQAGFSAAFTPIKCECAASAFVIPCNAEGATLTPLPNGIATYCDNQDCNYTISLDSSCTMDYYTINPSADLRNTSWLAIYVNGSVFQNFTQYGSPEHIPFPRNTNLTIVFHSGKSVSPFVIGTPRWSIGTTAIATPTTTKIMLNSTSQPTFAIWLDDMPADEAITVCSPDNDLELFIANGFSLNTFNLYDSDGLTNFVSTLSPDTFTQTSPGSSISVITSKSGCFTIYCAQKIGFYMSTALFRMKNTHTKNCNNQQNVVRLLQNVLATFTVNATNGGSCEMIVFSSQYNVNPFISLDDFQTSSSNAIFSFSSGLNGKPYFDMPSSETDLWKQTALYTPALRVVAPASSSLTFNISTGLTSIDEGSAKRKGILVSQLYSGNNVTIFLDARMYSFNLNGTRSANFVVKDLSPFATVMFLNTVTNENHTFIANENYSTNGSRFRITTVQNGNNAFRIEYGFDVLVNDATTTQPPATTDKNNGFMPSLHFTALFVSIVSALFCF
uniref:CUB domain-containing protein n=1 Tax=Panagrolaimus sp. PS1159 TaxID=55785 RepID=A0AC35GQY5_9BILA